VERTPCHHQHDQHENRSGSDDDVKEQVVVLARFVARIGNTVF
jgi:hypothetical protein